jgi:hypothetical protein
MVGGGCYKVNIHGMKAGLVVGYATNYGYEPSSAETNTTLGFLSIQSCRLSNQCCRIQIMKGKEGKEEKEQK